MQEKNERQMICRAFDEGLSGLREDPFLARRVLNQAERKRPAGKRRWLAPLAAMLALMLTAAGAYAVSQAVLSPRVDAKRMADRALEEKYGLTTAMLGFFAQDSGGADGQHWRADYMPEPDLAARLGAYQVLMEDGKVTSVKWTLEGTSTEGGFDAPAWGAEQLGEMVKITGKIHDMSRFVRLAAGEDVDVYAGMDAEEEALPEESEGWAEADEEIRAQQEAFRREIEESGAPYKAQSRFTEEELVELGRKGIIQAYDLTPRQQERLQFENTLFFVAHYSAYGLDNRPVYHMTFQSGGPDGWQEGDGIYTVVVNVLDGTVEYLDYDTTLDGNG